MYFLGYLKHYGGGQEDNESITADGVLPDWEHEENRDGGRWMVSVDKAQRQEMLDTQWLEVLILLMGENVGQTGSKLITGAEVCVRKKGERVEE